MTAGSRTSASSASAATGLQQDLAIVRALRRGGDQDAALVDLRAVLSRNGESALVRNEVGFTLLALGRLSEAEATFLEVLRGAPNDLMALRGVGRLALSWGDPDTACARFEEALAHDQGDTESLIGLADSLRAALRFDEAMSTYRKVLAGAPDHPRAWAGVGHIHRFRRDWSSAREAFAASARHNSESAEAHASLGNALCDLGAFAEAERTFDRALAIAPANLTALLGRVRACWLQGDGDAAQAALAAAEAAHPRHPRNAVARKKLLNGVARFDWKSDIANAQAALNAAGTPPNVLIEACARLVEYGIVEPLQSVLPTLAARSPRARRLQQAARSIARSELDWRAGGAASDADGSALVAFVERPCPSAGTAIIVFAGREERLFLGMEMLHRVLRSSGTSLIYVRDLERTRYFGGVVGLGDSFSSTIESLRLRLSRMNARRVLCIASCMGVAAALHFGLEMGAEAVLGLGPRLTPWEPPLTPEASAKLSELRAVEPRFFEDIPAMYARAAKTPKVTLIYAEGYESDAADLRSMAGLPNVAIAGIRGYEEHNCVLYLMMHGLLEPVVMEFAANGELSEVTLQRVCESFDIGKMPRNLKAVGGSAPPSTWF